ncbi:MAG: hypothetical protein R3F43_03760 [bacterium]
MIRIFLWVYEDDLAGDETLWRTDFAITAASWQRSASIGPSTAPAASATTWAATSRSTASPGSREGLVRLRLPLIGTTANIDVLEVQDDAAERTMARRRPACCRWA